MDAHVVIPARLASTRLPQKLLLRETGKTVLQHTYEAARQAKFPSGVSIAVDHPLLQAEVERFGGRAIMTSPDCPSGTDRIAEALQAIGEVDLVVNLQGDEPEMDPAAIDQVIDLLIEHPEASIATIATPIRDQQTWENPSCVKIAMGENRALYFSRSPIPHVRGGPSKADFLRDPPCFWHHLGLYAYRASFLRKFTSLSVGRLEDLEKLEQLRALETGHIIVVGRVDRASRGIDTEADYQEFVLRTRLKDSSGL